LDGFLGAGTTAIQAVANGRIAFGIDVHPVAVEIARARLAPVYPGALTDEVERIRRAMIHGRPSRVELPSDPGGWDWQRWFPAASHPVLSRLRHLIVETRRSDVRRLLLVATAGQLKSVSYWFSHATKLQFDSKKEPQDVKGTMLQRLEQIKAINQELWDHIGGRFGAHRRRAGATLAVGDCRCLPFDPESADLAVSSPPYFIAYDYARLLRLSSWWIIGRVPDGVGHLETGGRGKSLDAEPTAHLGATFGQVYRQAADRFDASGPGCSRTHVSELLRFAAPFFDGIRLALAEYYRVLRKGGKLCLVLGNTRHCGVTVPTAQITTELALIKGFRMVAIHVRRQHSATQPQARDELGQFTSEDSLSQYSYRDEYVIVLRKPK
jgi:DNA modification methylase